MTFSVIIPTYNSERFVTEAIDSVLAQTRPPEEILVIDDGSRDNTAARLARYGNKIRYLHQSNQGVSAARNHGVVEATSQYIAFLDADDFWHPQKLELQARICAADPELCLLGTRAFDWPIAACPQISLEAIAAPQLTLITWRDLVVRNRLITSSVVAKAESLRTAGPFDTQMQGPEDRDQWLRVAKLGRVANLELALTGYRSVAGSVSRQAFRCRAGMLRLLEKVDRQSGWNSARWGGALRCKSYASIHHALAYVFSAAGEHRQALLESLKALAWYPLPMPLGDVESPYERPRRLAVNFLRLCRLKKPDPATCPLH